MYTPTHLMLSALAGTKLTASKYFVARFEEREEKKRRWILKNS